jgi:hypothetical protein
MTFYRQKADNINTIILIYRPGYKIMKKLTIIAITIFLISSAAILFSQGSESPKSDSGQKSAPEGYGSAQWGSPASKAKDSVMGKITFIDEKRVITSRDGEIDYQYGFFFYDPSVVKLESAEKKEGEAGQPPAEARLYYVSISFPYIALNDVRKKIEEKYGAPNGESLTKNQGAVIWDSEKTTIILWVDRYENKPFSRKITYVSKAIAKEVNEYQIKVFSRQEIDILKKLAP